MSALIQQASENDNISTLFVSDQSGVFCGAIDLKELIIARPDTEFSSLIMTSYPYGYGHESSDDCIERLKDYSEDLVPVLDNQNRLLGVITAQSIIQVVDDEMGEDYEMCIRDRYNRPAQRMDSVRTGRSVWRASHATRSFRTDLWTASGRRIRNWRNITPRRMRNGSARRPHCPNRSRSTGR